MQADGSDAMHTDPDYSCMLLQKNIFLSLYHAGPYVTLHTNHAQLKSYGLTFTLGRGNEIMCVAVLSFKKLIIGTTLAQITSDFAGFYRKLTSETQMRWLGPEKGNNNIIV